MKLLLLVFYMFYLFYVYGHFWFNSDVLDHDSRLHHYQSQIIDFNCYIEKMSKGDGQRSVIYVELADETKLDFLAHKECHIINTIVPNPKGLMFSGYFQGISLMELEIGNKEVVSYSDMKKRRNILAAYIAISPLICWFTVQYIKRRKLKKGNQAG